MAAQRFEKGSEEWLMFMDFWNLCQKFYVPETSDSYWQELVNSVNNFYEKFAKIPLAQKLALALCDTQEERCKSEYRIH